MTRILMRPKLVLLLLAFSAAACSDVGEDGSRLYGNSDLVLVTGYTAKETCSCVFVMEQSEEFCQRWTQAAPAIATAHVDFEKKTVKASALSFWDATARFVDERHGCELVP